MRIHAGFLSNVLPTRGRSCMASLKTARKRRVREAGAAAAQPTKSRNTRAHPAAAPAAGAARAAARTVVRAQSSQDISLVVQRGRADGDAAAARAHPAEDCEAAPLSLPTACARDAAAAAAAGAAPARSADQREPASMRLLAQRARDGGEPAANGLRHSTPGEDVAGTSDGSLAPGTLDSASEPGGAAGDSPRAGGACCLSPAVLLSLGALLRPDSLCLLMAAARVSILTQCKLLGGPQAALAAVMPTLRAPPWPRQHRPRQPVLRRAARPASGGRPRATRQVAAHIRADCPPRAGPASGTGLRRPGYAAVPRPSSRVRRWARLRPWHILLARQSMRMTMKETRAAHCAVWARAGVARQPVRTHCQAATGEGAHSNPRYHARNRSKPPRRRRRSQRSVPGS